jgi:hypothetical protein
LPLPKYESPRFTKHVPFCFRTRATSSNTARTSASPEVLLETAATALHKRGSGQSTDPFRRARLAAAGPSGSAAKAPLAFGGVARFRDRPAGHLCVDRAPWPSRRRRGLTSAGTQVVRATPVRARRGGVGADGAARRAARTRKTARSAVAVAGRVGRPDLRPSQPRASNRLLSRDSFVPDEEDDLCHSHTGACSGP